MHELFCAYFKRKICDVKYLACILVVKEYRIVVNYCKLSPGEELQILSRTYKQHSRTFQDKKKKNNNNNPGLFTDMATLGPF